MPVFEAHFVMVLASRTGWSEQFIRWQLPLSRAWAYYHAANLLDGYRMQWPGAREGWWQRVLRRFSPFARRA